MKKNFLILIVTIFILTACNTPIKENKLKAKWTLDESLKPDITFTKSTDNDVNGIFYSEGQITYEEFRSYITTLEKNGFKLDWRYSDAETLNAIDKAKTKNEKGGIFSDGYINVRMCKDKDTTNKEICFFMQWVDKETYNKLNPENKVEYSFKLETENSK